jgi:hypothetical protein
MIIIRCHQAQNLLIAETAEIFEPELQQHDKSLDADRILE